MRALNRCVPSLLVVLGIVFGFADVARGLSWSRYAKRPDTWYQSAEGKRTAENVMSHQSADGSWPKNVDTARQPYRGDPARLRGTFDNGATRGELRFLARAYRATNDPRCLEAFHKGLELILRAQYANGGWPQSYPLRSGYSRHITFNDGTMVGLMSLLRDVADTDDFAFVDAAQRRRARRAFDQGVQCILQCQIVVDGKPTAWCAQHDEVTLQPRKARTYEHVSISGGESADIVLLLMSLKNPGPDVIRAVNGACQWYEQVQLRGIREIRRDGDKVIVADDNAPPLWARFYEIGTNRPIFSGRDGVIKYDVAEIEPERRNGYAWYGTWGRKVAQQWPAWRQAVALRDPPHEFSVMPFWFWNDALTEDELIRQIADFEAHGVYGFVIHPRVGLPRDIGFMSPRMIHFMKVAVAEAKRRGMYVVLYDEGMYPSGSASGQVVAHDPAHAARGLVKMDLDPGQEPQLRPGWNLVAVVDRPNGKRVAVIDRPSGGVIRGLHYLGEGPREETPPAGDILNPEAVASFMNLVYERYAEELGDSFGDTILAIFTDEPSMTGRGGRGLPGTTGILPEVNRILGYDFTPYLADLWYNDRPDSARRRADYRRAVAIRLEETFYQPLSAWCRDHGIALTGHPAGSMDIGMERYFQIPGQDLVWRYVTPGPKALEGEHSTMAKCASSAMIHLGRRRNSNELYGAYGHNLTFDEMQWLANWCFVRGQNLLYPHAFFYSVRGPRRDERPPDVGPNAVWWDQYRPYADACRRLSWLNTDSRHVCHVAILGDTQWLPDGCAKVCFQRQRDFNYLELRHLWEDARIDDQGVCLGGMTYKAVVLEGLPFLPPRAIAPLQQLATAGRLILWGTSPHAGTFPSASVAASDHQLVDAIDALVSRDLTLHPPSTNIRYRHVVKGDRHYYLLFNEESTPVSATVSVAPDGERQWWNVSTAETTAAPPDQPVSFPPHEMKLLCVTPR